MRLDIFSMRLCMGRDFGRTWLCRPVGVCVCVRACVRARVCVCVCVAGGGGVL